MMRRYFTFTESFQHRISIPIRPEDQDATNENFPSFTVVEISRSEVIIVPFIIIYYYTNSVDINRSPTRLYFNFLDDSENLPDTTI